MLHRPSLFPLAVALLGVTAAAQVRPGVYGHLVQGTTGTSGEFCHNVDCTPRQHTAVAGETLQLIVNAPFNALFVIGASFSATSCIPVPGVANDLVLDPPLVTLAIGLVSQPSPILACWGGTVAVPLALPATLPSGTAFATQAVAEVPTLTQPNGLAFSVAVVTTIR